MPPLAAAAAQAKDESAKLASGPVKPSTNISLFDAREAQQAERTTAKQRSPARGRRSKQLKSYAFSGDFDENGLFFDIGTSGGAHAWRNPAAEPVPDADAAAGRRVLCASSRRSKGDQNQMLFREASTNSDISGWTESYDNSYFAVDLGEGRAVRVTQYTIRQGNGCAKAVNWSLEGSNDAILDATMQPDDRNAKIQSGTWHELCMNQSNVGNFD